jgi:hypothetical protein
MRIVCDRLGITLIKLEDLGEVLSSTTAFNNQHDKKKSSSDKKYKGKSLFPAVVMSDRHCVWAWDTSARMTGTLCNTNEYSYNTATLAFKEARELLAAKDIIESKANSKKKIDKMRQQQTTTANRAITHQIKKFVGQSVSKQKGSSIAGVIRARNARIRKYCRDTRHTGLPQKNEDDMYVSHWVAE